jgi:hypothetical protein
MRSLATECQLIVGTMTCFLDGKRPDPNLIQRAAALMTKKGRLMGERNHGLKWNLVLESIEQEHERQLPSQIDFEVIASDNVERQTRVAAAERVLNFFRAAADRALQYTDQPPDFERALANRTIGWFLRSGLVSRKRRWA